MVNTTTIENDIESDYQYVLNYKYIKFEDSNLDYWDINIIYDNVNRINTYNNSCEFKIDKEIDVRNFDLSEEDKFELEFSYTVNHPNMIGWLNHWNQTNYYVLFIF